jgi:hypothetical protein
MAEDLLFGGAKSAVKGMRICGVTVKTPKKYDRTRRAMRLGDNATAMQNSVEHVRMRRSKGRRRTKSPRGVIRSRPVA